jgi:hypothetical protein
MIADDGAHDRTRAYFMAERSIRVSLEFVERRTRAQFLTKKEWLFGPDPDPAYDRVKGWKLDQFAMHFVPDLVRGYKRAIAEIHPHAIPRDPFESRIPWEWMEWSSELDNEIMRRLLDDRFEVSGCHLDRREPEVISSAFLEHMHPIIATSELCDINTVTETARWFEMVCVFDLKVTGKSSAGRKIIYDWPRLAAKLEKDKPAFPTKEALIGYCRERAIPTPMAPHPRRHQR